MPSISTSILSRKLREAKEVRSFSLYSCAIADVDVDRCFEMDVVRVDREKKEEEEEEEEQEEEAKDKDRDKCEPLVRGENVWRDDER
jgi:hypothetical protein